MTSKEIFPVAGIGSSAGGVEALQLLFQNMPPDTGMAFIVVSHLARDYHSLLPSIVARHVSIFSPHSVIRDPPFSRIDLISCRNLLIYLGSEFQSQVIPVFHFALRERGFLFLGTSENVTQHGDLFTPVDKKQRIFQRRDHAAASIFVAVRFTAAEPGQDPCSPNIAAAGFGPLLFKQLLENLRAFERLGASSLE